jgi:hypothetical protein
MCRQTAKRNEWLENENEGTDRKDGKTRFDFFLSFFISLY